MSGINNILPSISFGSTAPPPPSISDADMKAGAPLRDKARNQVLAEITYSNKLIPVLTKATVPQASITAYSSYLTTEIAWWNTNVELSPRQVAARKTNFEETIQTYHVTLNQKVLDLITTIPLATAKEILAQYPDEKFVPTLQGKINGIQKAAKTQTELASQKKLNTSVTDVALSAFYASLQYAGTILYILIAARCGSFAANEVLYKASPYRVLAFVYTFIFTPILGWYYLYREITHYIFPTTSKLPIFNSFLPIYSYTLTPELTVMYSDGTKPTENGKERGISFGDQIFGYNATSAIDAWIKAKQEEEVSQRKAALVTG